MREPVNSLRRYSQSRLFGMAYRPNRGSPAEILWRGVPTRATPGTTTERSVQRLLRRSTECLTIDVRRVTQAWGGKAPMWTDPMGKGVQRRFLATRSPHAFRHFVRSKVGATCLRIARRLRARSPRQPQLVLGIHGFRAALAQPRREFCIWGRFPASDTIHDLGVLDLDGFAGEKGSIFCPGSNTTAVVRMRFR